MDHDGVGADGHVLAGGHARCDTGGGLTQMSMNLVVIMWMMMVVLMMMLMAMFMALVVIVVDGDVGVNCVDNDVGHLGGSCVGEGDNADA